MRSPPGFTLRERDRRWQAVLGLLARNNLDGLITPPTGPLGPSAATRYLSATDACARSCLLHADGRLFCVGGARNDEANGWGQQIWAATAEIPRRLSELIQQLMGPAPRIGVIGSNNVGGDDDCLSLAFIRELESGVPGAVWVDCSVAFRSLRADKSSEEVAVIAHAVELAQRGLHQAAVAIRPGVADFGAWTETLVALERGGSEPPHRVLWGASVRPVIGTRPTHLELQRGHVVLVEIEASAAGYRCVLPQTFAVQACDAGLVELYARYPEFWGRALAALQPGATLADVSAACSEAAQQIAPAEGRLTKGEATISLRGCGLGRDEPWVTTAEEIDRARETQLEIGWVFTFAPTLRAQIARRAFAANWGGVVEITATGPRPLGTLAPGLWTTA